MPGQWGPWARAPTGVRLGVVREGGWLQLGLVHGSGCGCAAGHGMGRWLVMGQSGSLGARRCAWHTEAAVHLVAGQGTCAALTEFSLSRGQRPAGLEWVSPREN